MLNVEAARKIGIKACIDKLGRDFVMAHRDCATTAYGESEEGVYCFVGVDDQHWDDNGALILDSHSEFPYRVSCNVNLFDGTPNFIECIVPTQRVSMAAF